MKRIINYTLFLEGNKEKKALKRINKFFGVENIAQKAVDFNAKLSVWIINQFIDFSLEEYKNNDVRNKEKEKLKSGDLTQEESLKLIKKWYEFETDLYYIFDWLKSYDISETEKSNFTKLTFDEAYEKSDKWHNSLIAGGTIENEHGTKVLTFEDGFYWIDLETTYDRDEADAMGHCGNTDKGTTLYSLRDRNKNSHITVSINDKEGIIYQMKGKNNKKPIKKYHKYIVELLINKNIRGFGKEYDQNNDFSPSDLDKELYDLLLEKQPTINEPTFSEEEIKEKFLDLLDVYYVSDTQYHLVTWTYNVCGINSIFESFETNNTLFNILCEEFPKKVDPYFSDDFEKEKITKKFNIDFVSKYLSADKTADKYNIELSNPKDSSYNKWLELSGYIEDEFINIIKDENLEEKYNDEFSKLYSSFKKFRDSFTNKRKTIYGYKENFDYKSVLMHFFDYDYDNDKHNNEAIMNFFDDFFDDGDPYNYNLSDVFDFWILATELADKLPTGEKEMLIDEYEFW